MASIKFVGVSCSLKDIMDYITNREKTTDSLVTGVNCVAQSALYEFETVARTYFFKDDASYTARISAGAVLTSDLLEKAISIVYE